MSAIAGQTAGPNWLKLFDGTNGYPGSIKIGFLKIITRAMPGTSASCFDKTSSKQYSPNTSQYT